MEMTAWHLTNFIGITNMLILRKDSKMDSTHSKMFITIFIFSINYINHLA